MFQQNNSNAILLFVFCSVLFRANDTVQMIMNDSCEGHNILICKTGFNGPNHYLGSAHLNPDFIKGKLCSLNFFFRLSILKSVDNAHTTPPSTRDIWPEGWISIQSSGVVEEVVV